MKLNADFSQRVVVHAARLPWVESPMPGVSRRMLDRIGEEVARATSIVRYAPGSQFSPHVHSGGEEFLVLEGVFQDEHGDFPAGSYVRNPPLSKHTPASEPGCIIFVKLRQFDSLDRSQVRLAVNEQRLGGGARQSGVTVAHLHSDDREDVRLETWRAGANVTLDTTGGAEVLVLDGSFSEQGDTLEQQSWIRVPINGDFSALVGDQGARVWVKEGHLRFVD